MKIKMLQPAYTVFGVFEQGSQLDTDKYSTDFLKHLVTIGVAEILDYEKKIVQQPELKTDSVFKKKERVKRTPKRKGKRGSASRRGQV